MKNTTNGIDPGDRKARTDATYAPDARKAREVVRSEPWHSLSALALAIARVTSEQAVKHKLEERAERFIKALEVYAREELKAPGYDIGWMGPPNGVIPPIPQNAGFPEHKIELAEAWNAVLFAVNEATKVGVHKLNRYRPIELQADLQDGPKLIAGGVTWD